MSDNQNGNSQNGNSQNGNSDDGNESVKGIVKWFNDAKGFGFIQHPNGKDVFVHFSTIASEGFKTLKDGEEVEYEFLEGPKGLQATKVLRVNPPAAEEKQSDKTTEVHSGSALSDGSAMQDAQGMSANMAIQDEDSAH